MQEIKVGDKVLSTWSLSNDAFATPKVVNDVDGNIIYAGGVFYHVDDVEVIEQRPIAEAKAKLVPVVFVERCLAEDCVLALDLLLRGDNVEAEDIPPWLVTTASMVIDLI